jgi:general nucleoside transport system permease protein
MVVVIQGLIILFSGALVNMPRPWLQWLQSRFSSRAA